MKNKLFDYSFPMIEATYAEVINKEACVTMQLQLGQLVGKKGRIMENIRRKK